MFPDVAADKSDSEHARQRLESCLQAAWDTLDKEIFDSLYQSMPRRIAACIAANGWHTKYWGLVTVKLGQGGLFWRQEVDDLIDSILE